MQRKTAWVWAIASSTAVLLSLDAGGEPPATATTTIVAPLHMLGVQGEDLVLAPGSYSVEAVTRSQLRLKGPDGKSVLLAASVSQVGVRPQQPLAAVTYRRGQPHVILTLPDGWEFDAASPPSGPPAGGVTSRGVTALTATTVRPPVLATPLPVATPAATTTTTSTVAVPTIQPSSIQPTINFTVDPCTQTLGARPVMVPFQPSGSSAQTPTISKVVPSTFAEGQDVTICGSGLNNTWILYQFVPWPDTSPTAYGFNDWGALQSDLVSGSFVGLQTSPNINLPPVWIMAMNPMMSTNGDRITFTAASSFQNETACDHNVSPSCNTAGAFHPFLAPSSPPIAPVTGSLRLANTLGPSVTWKPGPPVVQSLSNGLLSLGGSPYIDLDSGPPGHYGAMVFITGTNLYGAEYTDDTVYTVDGTPTTSPGVFFDSQHAWGTTIEVFVASPTPNLASTVCVVRHGNMSSCKTIPIFHGPQITSGLPAVIHARTAYTLSGTNLTPPPGISVNYQWWMSPFSPSSATPGLACYATTLPLQILAWTSTSLTFSLGNPNDATPLSTTCTLPPVGGASGYFIGPNRQAVYLWNGNVQ